MVYGAHIQKKASLTSTASASVVMFASIDNTRWHWTKGVITVYGAGVGASVEILEVIDASAAATLMIVPVVTNMLGLKPIDFGDKGFQASQAGSRLIAQVAGADASVNMLFVGYRR